MNNCEEVVRLPIPKENSRMNGVMKCCASVRIDGIMPGNNSENSLFSWPKAQNAPELKTPCGNVAKMQFLSVGRSSVLCILAGKQSRKYLNHAQCLTQEDLKILKRNDYKYEQGFQLLLKSASCLGVNILESFRGQTQSLFLKIYCKFFL